MGTSFDEVKEHEGQAYTGMRVGGRHRWVYAEGPWEEQKEAPERWRFTYAAQKRRRSRAPAGSGAPVGTEYHWYLLAHQRVRKLDEDSYDTLMEGVKHKVAHKRPHWRRWSTEYRVRGRPTERQRLIAILEEELARLREEEARAAPARLDAWLGEDPGAGAEAEEA